MAEGTLTHADLAAGVGVSVTSIKGYRRKFASFIPVAGWGKPIRFKPEALDVCKRIHGLFQEGLSEARVRQALKREFEEYEEGKAEEEAAAGSSPAFAAGISEESFKDFFKAAGQMMHGMAALATAQARADQRLSRLERSLQGLLEAQAESVAAVTALAGELRQFAAGRGADSGPVRARRVVTVRGDQGQAATYAFEPGAAPEPAPSDLPPDALLALPVAIRSERGEFLGVPGRLSLAAFVRVLERQAGHAEGGHASWSWEKGAREEGSSVSWVLTLDMGGRRHDLRFTEVTTPSHVQVALLSRLDVDGAETSPAFLQEFLRQIKDRV